MSSHPVQTRRAFLAAAASVLALPAAAESAMSAAAVSGAARTPRGFIARHRAMTIGGQIVQSLNLPQSAADGAFLRDPYHYRVRIASSELSAIRPAEYLDPRGVALATVMAEVLHAHRRWKLQIIGHSTDTGTELKDYMITARLTESLRATLISRGVDASKIEAYGAGSRAPAPDFAADRIELLISA